LRLNNPPGSSRGDLVNGFAFDEVVRELYFDDNLEAAWEQGLERGLSRLDMRFYRLLEAEYLTRQRAQIMELRAGLTFEYNPHEHGLHLHHHSELIRNECEAVAARFGWDFREEARITVLIAEVDAPWHYHRAGYCIDKYPFEKICIPASSLHHEGELRHLIRHEFMHAITMNLCNGHEPVWLTEGLSVFVEGTGPTGYWRRFRDGGAEWRDPMYLSGGIKANRWGNSVEAIREGYEQASIVVAHLHSLGGDAKLAELMNRIGDEGVRSNFFRSLLGRTRTDEALRAVFGLSESQAFAKARDWLANVKL